MDSGNRVRKFVVPEVVYGAEAHQLVGRYAAGFALRTVLVVSDPGVEAVGWTDAICDRLSLAGIEPVRFCEITSNPKDHEVMAGVDRYHQAHCDGLVAVGGGSPMDCAKGIGIVTSNGGQILDFAGVDLVRLPMPPLICVPTTAGTAADISQFAILTDSTELRKLAIISKSLVPDVALIDPLLTLTMPAGLTACTGMDALVHAIEAYVSNASSPFTDIHALEAVRVIGESLGQAVLEPNSLAARDAMMFACTQAGMAFSNASLGAVHAMAHSLGGMLDAPHGFCNAQLLAHVVRFNFPAAAERYRTIAHTLGLPVHGKNDQDACETLVAGLAGLKQSLGIDGQLTARNLDREQISRLAARAMQDACMVTNPRQPTQKDIEDIYAAAL